MKKWSDLYETPKGFLTTIIVLFIVYCLFNLDKVVIFLDALFCVLLNKVLPVVLAVAVIVFLLKNMNKK